MFASNVGNDITSDTRLGKGLLCVQLRQEFLIPYVKNAGIILLFIFKTIIEYKYRSIIENKH